MSWVSQDDQVIDYTQPTPITVLTQKVKSMFKNIFSCPSIISLPLIMTSSTTYSSIGTCSSDNFKKLKAIL